MTDGEKAIKAVCEVCDSYWYCHDKKQLGDCVYNRKYVEGLIEGRKEENERLTVQIECMKKDVKVLKRNEISNESVIINSVLNSLLDKWEQKK